MRVGVLRYKTAAAPLLRSCSTAPYSCSTSAIKGMVSGGVGGLEKKVLPEGQAVLATLLAVEE